MDSKKLDIKITSNLIKKLLSGENIKIYDKEGYSLPKEENETLRDLVFAEVLKGEFEKVISIYYEKEVHKKTPNGKNPEIYETEEIYRLPYPKNKKWLRTAIKNAQEQWYTSFANRI